MLFRSCGVFEAWTTRDAAEPVVSVHTYMPTKASPSCSRMLHSWSRFEYLKLIESRIHALAQHLADPKPLISLAKKWGLELSTSSADLRLSTVCERILEGLEQHITRLRTDKKNTDADSQSISDEDVDKLEMSKTVLYEPASHSQVLTWLSRLTGIPDQELGKSASEWMILAKGSKTLGQSA